MAKKKGEVSAFEPKTAKADKKKPAASGLIAIVVIVLVIAYFVMSGIKIIKLNQEKEEAEARKQELLHIQEDLLAQYENINSAQYIERLARRDLKLVKSNELLFILPEETKERQQDGEAED